MRKHRRVFDDDIVEQLYQPEDLELPESGDRWSTWDQSSPTEKGPLPYPDWLVTELAAVDFEHGILKTGKEADACLITRAVPGTDRSVLLVAKRYRSHDHRMFHRDSGYLEGRRVRESRVNRAMASRSDFGKEAIAGTWAYAEFGALCRIWEVCKQMGVDPFVPYPVQIVGTEVLMEFIGAPDRTAAPRLAEVRGANAESGQEEGAFAEARPGRPRHTVELADLWQQMLISLTVMALAGYTHGDLSAYNLLVHEGRLVVIDLPQIVDVVANPQGRRFMERDVHNVVEWFTARGVTGLDETAIVSELLAEAGIR